MATINTFLKASRAYLNESHGDINLVIVTGNDSADLDSIISALLFAYLSAQETAGGKTVFLPLVKVPSADLALRPEVDYVLGSAGVRSQNLICLDDMDLEKLRQCYLSVKVVLVDHNQLTSPFDASWDLDVVGVVDHHQDEKYYMHAPLRHIEMVGSCTTLVVLHFAEFLKSNPETRGTLSAIAIAPILVDTIGMRQELGKTTDQDVDAFKMMAQPIGSSGMDKAMKKYLDEIEAIKSRVDHLSSRDLLRKDYKEFVVQGFRIGTSSVSWHFAAWTARDGIETMVQATLGYAKERHLDMEVVLTSYDHKIQGGGYKRELALFTRNKALNPVRFDLQNRKDIDLSLLPLEYDDADDDVVFYNQGNIRYSRKQIWPFIQTIVKNLSNDCVQ